jgi:hypothetical protein
MDFSSFRATLQKTNIINKQRLFEIEKLKVEYNQTIIDLRNQINRL